MDSTSVVKGLAYGGIASCIAEVLTMPMDVAKVRMQLQNKQAPRYSGLVNCVSTIAREEGIGSLWNGIRPALLRQATYGSARYGLYTPVKKLLTGDGEVQAPGSFPLWKKVVAGAVSGACASAMANPTDVVKVRMQQADGIKGGLFRAFGDIVRADGVLGLMKGVGPTVQRASVLAAVELSSYDEVRVRLREGPIEIEGAALHIASAACSGFLAALASSPFDVAKSRMMATGQMYTSTMDCFAKTVQNEGVLALWNGFFANYARVGPRVMIIFVAMEQLRAHFD